MDEIKAINNSLTQAWFIFNQFFQLKSQIVNDLYINFQIDKKAFSAFLEETKNKKTDKVRNEIFFLLEIPIIEIPSNDLKKTCNEKLTADIKILALSIKIDETAEALKSSTSLRNQWIKEYRERRERDQTKLDDLQFACLYFGLTSPKGTTDTNHQNYLEQIHIDVDNGIYFSMSLIKELTRHASSIKEKYYQITGQNAPKVFRIDLQTAEIQKLLPDSKLYSSWEQAFPNKQ